MVNRATIALALLAAAISIAQNPAGSRTLRPIVARKQVALIIGNAAYPDHPLVNPVNDARDVAAMLKRLNYDVILVANADHRAMDRAIDQFIGKLGAGDVALFYYSGHGMQLDGENYLVPVDFVGKNEDDARYDAEPVGRIQDRMERSRAQLRILVLDACRNNPYRSYRGAGSGGLARMDGARGTFIAFPTSPGKYANDNPNGKNGLFTEHLLQALPRPGLSLDDVFNVVRERVDGASEGRQLPWSVSSVIGRYSFVPEPVRVDLQGAFNTIGITTDGKPYTGGLDGGGWAYSAAQLDAARSRNDLPFAISPPDVLNVVTAAGAKPIALPEGYFTRVELLATGVNGNQTAQKLTITYTDGSIATYTDNYSDWYTPRKYPFETPIKMEYRNYANGAKDTFYQPIYVYRYSFALDKSKAVSRLTLPPNPYLKVLAVTLGP